MTKLASKTRIQKRKGRKKRKTKIDRGIYQQAYDEQNLTPY
jgi:hypothetical protein